MAERPPGTDCLLPVPDNISVAYLPNHTKLSQKAHQKGLNYFTQGYIHDIKIYSQENHSVHVNCKCWRSMTKSQLPHKLQLELDVITAKVADAYCSCKDGLSGRCSHIIGLIKTLQGLKLHNFSHVPEQQSCTSIPQQWHVPRGSKISPIPINQVVVARPTENRKRKPILCQLASDTKLPNVSTVDIKGLQDLKGTPLEYMLQPDTPTVTTSLGDVQIGSVLSYQTRNLKRISPAASTTCTPLKLPKVSRVKLPTEFEDLNSTYHVTDPEQLEVNTRGQAQCNLWKQSRSNRLTASNFGKIMMRKKKPTHSLLNSVFPKKAIHAPSLSYGKNNEQTAKKKYLEKFPSAHMHECGFVVNNEFSFLGATPDAKLCSSDNANGIVEIKCPYSARNFTLEEAWRYMPNFFLQKDENGNLNLRKGHLHYAQIQGQLMITGADFCEFVVYTKKDLHVEQVHPDTEYMTSMLNKLATFFRDHAKPFLDHDNDRN